MINLQAAASSAWLDGVKTAGLEAWMLFDGFQGLEVRGLWWPVVGELISPPTHPSNLIRGFFKHMWWRIPTCNRNKYARM